MLAKPIVRRVYRGEKVHHRAADWNAIADAVNQPPPAIGTGKGGGYSSMMCIRVKNISSDLDRFSILGVSSTGPLFDPTLYEEEFLRFPILKGYDPSEPEDLGGFVVLREPIKRGDIGWAAIAGITPVQVQVDDEDHAEFADITDGVTSYLLAGDYGSAKIVYRESGTGVVWAYVLLGAGLPLRPSSTNYHVLQTQEVSSGVYKVVWDYPRMHE